MLKLDLLEWRPDAVYRTGVIQPYPIRQVGPVGLSRKYIQPFVGSVRPMGPSVVAPPTPETVAKAAAAVATAFQQGKSARVKLGPAKVTVSPYGPTPPGLVGKVVEAARNIMAGRPQLVRVGPRTAMVRPAAPRPGAMPMRPARPGAPGPGMRVGIRRGIATPPAAPGRPTAYQAIPRPPTYPANIRPQYLPGPATRTAYQAGRTPWTQPARALVTQMGRMFPTPR